MLFFMPICYATASQIVRTHFQFYLIARYYSYAVHAQLASQVTQYHGTVGQLHAENSVGQGFDDLSGGGYAIVFGHGSILRERFHALIVGAAFGW